MKDSVFNHRLSDWMGKGDGREGSVTKEMQPAAKERAFYVLGYLLNLPLIVNEKCKMKFYWLEFLKIKIDACLLWAFTMAS